MANEALKENTNCLSGMKCPQCGSVDEFGIAVTMFVSMTDDGADLFGDQNWDDNSVCFCPACKFNGHVRNFRDNVTDTSEAKSTDEMIVVLSDNETWEVVNDGITIQVRSEEDMEELVSGSTPKHLESAFKAIRLVDILGNGVPEPTEVVIDTFGGKAEVRSKPSGVLVKFIEHDPLSVDLAVEGGVVEVESLPKGIRLVIDDKDSGTTAFHGED